MNLQELNHWWATKEVKKELVPETYRDIFHVIQKNFTRRHIQILSGLRRTGKSTILFQLINALLKEKTPPLHIFYCSFDEPELQEKRIEEILKEYTRITGIDYKKEKITVFIDEAQKSRYWTEEVKMLYDHFKNIKMLISGSASLDIVSSAKKNLAGRALYYELKPLHFREFLELKKITIHKHQSALHEELLKKEFEQFLMRPLPELVHEKDLPFIKNYIRNVVIDPVILKDIPKEFKDVDIFLLEKLIEVFLSNPGQYLNIDDLARDMKRGKTTLYKALFYLEFSFLIKRVFNFRPSTRTASRKLSRVYAYHPSLTLSFGIPDEKYAENMVFFELDTKYYWRDKEKEIDFLKNMLPVEVKYTSKIDRHDTRWIVYFLKKYARHLNVKKAYIITKDVGGKRNSIELLPLWKFCFSGLS